MELEFGQTTKPVNACKARKAHKGCKNKTEHNFKSKENIKVTSSTNNSDSCFIDFVSNCCSTLCEWVSDIGKFITIWFEEDEEEEIEEEKKREEKLCEERCEQKKEIEKMCRNHKARQKKANELYRQIEELKSKILSHFLFAKHSNNNCNLKDTFLKQDVLNIKYQDEKMSEAYYKNKEEEIADFLPPAYVCEHIGVGNLELDLLC